MVTDKDKKQKLWSSAKYPSENVFIFHITEYKKWKELR